MTHKKIQWLDTAVFYEIYPQSFYDTNADGIGDINGIIEKLDYIKSLGCNALWINPCFESPFNDAGYDVSDYYKIAARYGTNEDARRLFTQAHKRGIRVLFDLVPGHTSIEHDWFKQSKKMTENQYSGRYIWANDPWEHFEGIQNISGFLNGVSDRGTCAVNFYTTQPALNYGFANPDKNKPWQIPVTAPDARATKLAMMDIMDFWLSMGCDGFRVDMAHSMVKNDHDYKETIAFWQEVRNFLDEKYPEAVLVSEWGEPDKSLAAGFHMDFLLHFGPSHYVDLFRENPYFAGKGDLTKFVEYYKIVMSKAGKDGLICIPSGNHDMRRLSRHLDIHQLKLAFAFTLSMPGAPFIYYGDEIGMRYHEDLQSHEGGYERTGSRTPMQWDTSLNAGFSSAKRDMLYLPIDSDENRPNVATQSVDDDSLLCEVKSLIQLRCSHKALQNHAEIEFISCGAYEEPLSFIRNSGDEQIFVGINPFDKPKTVKVNGGRVLHSVGEPPKILDNGITLSPHSAAFVVIEK